MFIPADYDLLREMAGINDPSPELIAEYDTRLNMFHRGHGHGPIGVAMMVDLLRFMDIKPKPITKADGTIDWKKHIGTRVEARADMDSEWKPGEIRRIAGAGRLVVKHDDTDWLGEYSPMHVRLKAEEPELPHSDVPIDEEPELPHPEEAVDNDVYPFEAADKGDPVRVVIDKKVMEGQFVKVAPAQVDAKGGETLLEIRVFLDGEDKIREFEAQDVAIAG